MSKRVYIAAPWIDRDAAKMLGQLVEQAGHIITHKWWGWEGEEEEATDAFKRECAILDVNGVASADVVLVYNSFKSEGKAAEQGIAIALGKPIVCFTPGEKPSSNIFHYLPCYTHVKTIEEALEAISGE